MDRYTIYTMLASAILSAYAFVAANDKPDVEYINFEEPIVITASLKN